MLQAYHTNKKKKKKKKKLDLNCSQDTRLFVLPVIHLHYQSNFLVHHIQQTVSVFLFKKVIFPIHMKKKS
jgi:hypothetical protein